MKNENTVFNAYSHYYDLLYNDKDYVAETNYIKKLLSRHGIAKGSLLEFGSGTGKHGNLLATEGFRVHGIERSTEMVAQAQQGNGFTCQQGDICSVRMNHYFDAVLSLFHVVSYQTSNDDINAVFARAAEHLQIGGLFIFDFWYSPAVYTQHPVVRIKRMANTSTEITRIAEPVIYPNENRVDVNYTIYAKSVDSGEIKILNETHPMRHFSLPEIDIFAQTHGFIRITTEEFLTGNPASMSTWGVCVTLKRVN